MDLWIFPKKPVEPQQSEFGSASMSLRPKATVFFNDTNRMESDLLIRVRSQESDRFSFDPREMLLISDLHEWGLIAGFAQIRWGVFENVSVVDAVNAIDWVEDPLGRERLGQPIAGLTWMDDQGWSINLLFPFWRRQPTFPEQNSRLRGRKEVITEKADFPDHGGEIGPDAALSVRYSGGNFDLGCGFFYGASRVPYLREEIKEDKEVLVPVYEEVRQASVWAQWTSGASSVKLEGGGWATVDRSSEWMGACGFEHTLYSKYGNAGDIIMSIEYVNDPRFEKWLPWDNDLITMLKFQSYAVSGWSVWLGGSVDLDKTSINGMFGADTRLKDDLLLGLDALWFAKIDEADPQYDKRKDSYVKIYLKSYF